MLLLPLLTVPSVWAGARASKITEAAKAATAERVRHQDHLFKAATTPGSSHEARVFNLGGNLVDRHRQVWDDVTVEMALAQLRAGILRAVGWAVFAAGYVGVIALTVSHASQGRATPSDVLLVIALASDVNAQVACAAALADKTAGTFSALGGSCA